MAVTKQILKQSITPGNLIGDTLSLWSGYSTYKNAKREGESNTTSILKGIGNVVWSEMYMSALNSASTETLTKMGFGPKGVGIGSFAAAFVVPTLAGMGSMAGTYWENTTQKMTSAFSQKGRFGSGYFNMNEAGYTMRQRSLNAIHSNGINTQSVLGNEARTYFRSSL